MVKKVNQIRPPRVNHIGPTQKEPKKVRLYFKSGNSSMLLCKNITEADALRFEVRMRRQLKDMGVKLEGTIIQTQ